ncbi:MAG: hypothetical protein ACK5XN_20300 [Bacteroidota bacterium]
MTKTEERALQIIKRLRASGLSLERIALEVYFLRREKASMATKESLAIKAGDKLAFSYRGMGPYGRWDIVEVEKVTPTGMIVMVNGKRLNPDLTVRGRTPYSCSPYRGEPVTDKILDEFERDRIIRGIRSKVDCAKWDQYSTEQLATILAALECIERD